LYRVEILQPEKGQLEVRVAVLRTNMAVKIFLGFFVGLTFLGPIVVAILMAGELRPRFFIGMLGVYAAGFWFLRSLLWNTHGTEVFLFSPGTLSIINDYKWFKAPRITINTTDLKIGYGITDSEINEGGIEIKEGLFVFTYDNKQIESSVKLPEFELVYASNAMDNYLENSVQRMVG
jgi:hypothetical protein